MAGKEPDEAEILEQARSLIRDKRATCLWFLQPDFQPQDVNGYIRSMRWIERFGSRRDYQEARRIREWLLRNSSSTSAVS
jgi:hypothetical protein